MAAVGAANTLDISGVAGAAGVFDADSFLDACQKLGDAQASLAGIAVHSATYNLMLKADLISFVKPSAGNDDIPTYIGKRVIVDDGMPVAGANYTSYIFGPGAIGYAEGSPKTPSDVGREPLQGGGLDYIVNRRKYVMHPRGIKWKGTPAKPTASNVELAASANWERVYEAKQIRIVRFVHKVA
jgi:hypothetical protein